MEENGNYYGILGLYWDNEKENGNYNILTDRKGLPPAVVSPAGQCRIVEDIFNHGYGVWESRSIRAVAVKGRDLLHAKWPCRQTARVGAKFFSAVARDDTKRHVELGKKAGCMGVALS